MEVQYGKWSYIFYSKPVVSSEILCDDGNVCISAVYDYGS